MNLGNLFNLLESQFLGMLVGIVTSYMENVRLKRGGHNKVSGITQSMCLHIVDEHLSEC